MAFTKEEGDRCQQQTCLSQGRKGEVGREVLQEIKIAPEQVTEKPEQQQQRNKAEGGEKRVSASPAFSNRGGGSAVSLSAFQRKQVPPKECKLGRMGMSSLLLRQPFHF